MIANVMHTSESDMDKPKTSKHMMERKRRARINDSLLQLKSLVFPAIRKEMSRQPKMEKADILEMTVRYLKEMQSSATAGQSGRLSPSAQISQYHAGFNECLGEASTFLAGCDSVDLDTRLRIMNHLAERCSSLPEPHSPAAVSSQQQQQQQACRGYSPRVAIATATPAAAARAHQPAASPAVSPAVPAPVCNGRVPATTQLMAHGVQHHQHLQQQQLLLSIPHDFVAQTSPCPSSLTSQSSGRSSVLFPTPPPSPVEVTVAAKPAQLTRLPAADFRPKARSGLAAAYRRHPSPVGVPAVVAAAQENVWRPW